MKSVNIRLSMMTDRVKRFVSIVERYPFDIDLRSGRDVVDAKSIMGMMALGLALGDVVTIEAEGTDEEEAASAIAEFLEGK